MGPTIRTSPTRATNPERRARPYPSLRFGLRPEWRHQLEFDLVAGEVRHGNMGAQVELRLVHENPSAGSTASKLKRRCERATECAARNAMPAFNMFSSYPPFAGSSPHKKICVCASISPGSTVALERSIT